MNVSTISMLLLITYLVHLCYTIAVAISNKDHDQVAIAQHRAGKQNDPTDHME